MKKGILLILTVFQFAIFTKAQESNISNEFGFGFHLNQYQDDFGLGLNMTSPYFLYDNIAVRLRGNFMFYQHVQDNETVWSPYSSVSFGVVAVGGNVGDFIRLYGEGGIIGLFPSTEFSDGNFVFGGYGLFGFEFFMSKNFNYFIELGGVGTGAKADKLPANPIYSNGFLISVGFRFQIK